MEFCRIIWMISPILLASALLVTPTVSSTLTPHVLVEDQKFESELEWTNVTVSNGLEDPVEVVEVAALPSGSKVYLHYVKGLLQQDEADKMIQLCDKRQGWRESPIRAEVTPESGELDVSINVNIPNKKTNLRTSSSCPLLYPIIYRKLETDPNAYGEKGLEILDEYRLSMRVSRRVARLMNVEDVASVEPLQLVRYQHGEYYRTHHDHGAYYGYASESRPYTVLIFLNTVDENDGGGHTSFPTLKTKVLPKVGDAILWSNVNEQREVLQDAIHEAISILKPGTVKYVANVWLNDSPETILGQAAFKTS